MTITIIINITPPPAFYIYNGQPQGPNEFTITTLTGSLISDDFGTIAITYSGSNNYLSTTTPPKNVGTYQCTISVAAYGNYNNAISQVAFTINKAPSAINLNLLTYTYNGTPQGPKFPGDITITSNGNQVSDYNGTLNIVYGSGTTLYNSSLTPPTNIGMYSVNVNASSTPTNYNLPQQVAAQFQITLIIPTITINETQTTYTYNGSKHGPTSVTLSLNGNTITDDNGLVTFNYTGTNNYSSHIRPTDVGIYNAIASIAASGNYTFAMSNLVQFEIKEIEVTPIPKCCPQKVNGNKPGTIYGGSGSGVQGAHQSNIINITQRLKNTSGRFAGRTVYVDNPLNVYGSYFGAPGGSRAPPKNTF